MVSLKLSAILCGFIILYMVRYARNAKIVGGTLTTINHHKFQVYLRKQGRFFCGGSLLRARYVVTAAHCVKGVNKDTISVHGNTSYLNEPGVRRRAVKVLIPEGYDKPPLNMDVAVIKLDSPMVGKNVQPIALYPSKVPDNATVVVTGWGITNDTYVYPPNQLRKATVRIINKERCQRQVQANLTSTMICASINGKKDTCSGDSGGPMVYMGKLAGITSFGEGCARPNKPGVYTATEVFRVRRFIQRALQM